MAEAQTVERSGRKQSCRTQPFFSYWLQSTSAGRSFRDGAIREAAEEAVAAKKAAQNKRVVDQVFGSGNVKLLEFSVSQLHLRRGESTNLCYGVSNAVSVTIEPHIEDTRPTYHYCLQVEPKKTTTYTLTAKDAAGHVETGIADHSGELTIHVFEPCCADRHREKALRTGAGGSVS